MAYTTFESDLLDASTPFAHIPAGAIIMLAGPYSRLSDSDFASLGLLKCDGTSHLVATYPRLHTVIGYTYGGSGTSFNVPNLHATKLSIKGAPSTTIGTITNTANHVHDIGDVTWNSNNNAPVSANGVAVAMTHTHNGYASNRTFTATSPAAHEHNGTTPSYNGIPNTDSSNATNGNTSNNGTPRHNHNFNFNAYNSSNSAYSGTTPGGTNFNAHTHTVPTQALNGNTMYNTGTTAFTNIHLHPVTLNTSNSSNSITGYPVPYSPMLYFIKA
jgi:microcystin-dependent protein